DGLSAQLREVLRQVRRGPAAEGIGVQVERAALEQRAYQRRMVFGGPRLRGGVVSGVGAQAQGVPVCFSQAVAMGLPMIARFKARLLAEVHPQVDQTEAQTVALKGVALGRMVSVGVTGGRRA